MWYCWPRLGLEAVISFQEKIMSPSNFASEAIKRKQDSEGRQHGMEQGDQQRSFAEETCWASDENSAEPDISHAGAYQGSVWWSAQKLGWFLWAFSRLLGLGWTGLQTSWAKPFLGDFWKFLFFLEVSQEGYLLLFGILIPSTVKPRKAKGNERAELTTFFEHCKRLNLGSH